MDEKRDYTPDAPAVTETSSLLPTYELDVKAIAPPSAAASAHAPTAPPARSPAARDAKIRTVDFIQRLVPGYIHVFRSREATPASALRPASTRYQSAAFHAQIQQTAFVQRLVPSYFPVFVTEDAEMGHLAQNSYRPGVMGIILIAVTLLCFAFTATGGVEFGANRTGDQRQVPGTGAAAEAMAGKRLVPLEAHVMSKCPDTKACLQELVLPAMERISSKVDFTLSFLGRPTANDGVECMHGAPECLGNILLLCAAHYYPTPLALPFAMCLENDYKNIPNEELVRQCALEHAVDFDRLNACASDQETALGLKLLRDSVERSIALQVRKSCTVRLANQVYCIHDGDWKECPKGPGVNDLVLEIEKLYNNQNF